MHYSHIFLIFCKLTQKYRTSPLYIFTVLRPLLRFLKDSDSYKLQSVHKTLDVSTYRNFLPLPQWPKESCVVTRDQGLNTICRPEQTPSDPHFSYHLTVLFFYIVFNTSPHDVTPHFSRCSSPTMPA